MSAPQLAYGGTTVTLPYPTAKTMPTRSVVEQGGEGRTVTGALRRWVGTHWYVYQVSFEGADRATYDAIVALVHAAATAGAFPTFTWSGGPWPSAESGVAVSVAVGDMAPSDYQFAIVDFDLTLTESVART